MFTLESQTRETALTSKYEDKLAYIRAWVLRSLARSARSCCIVMSVELWRGLVLETRYVRFMYAYA